MSGYAALLENYLEEEKYANDTFASISSYLESLTDFVNEDVNFDMTISLTEAETGDIKEKDKKVSATIKNGITKLISKLESFIGKIREAVKRYVTKAKITIAQCGNEALKKMISNNKYTIGKDIKVKVISFAGKDGSELTNHIYKEALTGAKQILQAARDAADSIANGTEIKTVNKKELLDTLCVDIAGSNVAKDEDIKASQNMSVSKAYADYVEGYLKSVNKNLPAVESTCDDSQKKCKEIIKALKKAENGATVNANAIASVSAMSADAMKICTYIINYSMSILTMATKNSAKLALAAVDATGKAAAAVVKDKAAKAGKDFANSDVGAAANKAALKTEEKLSSLKGKGKKEDKED